MSNLSLETWLRFLAWLAIGMVVYLGYGRRNARLAVATEPYPEGRTSASRATSARASEP